LRDGYEQEVITELDLRGSGILTAIWATGQAFWFQPSETPHFDADGYPIQKRGLTEARIMRVKVRGL
jgi:hypothetical protein